MQAIWSRNNVSNDRDEFDADDVLWKYTTSFHDGTAPDLAELIHRSPLAERETFTLFLLRSVTELRKFDLIWLASQLESPGLMITHAHRIEILRNVYRDMVSLGMQVSGDHFDLFGGCHSDLRLRCSDDRFYLGEIVGNSYRITERIGSGGVAVVYRGVSLIDGRSYAVRVPRKFNSEADEKAKELIRSEGLLLKSLSVSGIPSLIALLESAEGPVVILEFIDGAPPVTGPDYCTEVQALCIVATVAKTVDSLHQRGYVHGDIKIGNVLVNKSGKVFLNDFNVSRSANPSHHADGKPLGTLGQMSPETILGVAADTDIREDIYSLGSMLFELIEGTSLIKPTNREEAVVMSILMGGVHEPEFKTTVSAMTRRIVVAAVSRHPDKRFETAGDFSESCLASASGTLDPTEIPPKNRLLAAWRLGTNLGYVATRLGIVKRSMMEIRGETNPHLSQTFHYGLGHAIGVSLSIEDMIRNARYLAIHFEEPGFSKLFTSYFYKKSKLTIDDIEPIENAITEGEAWFKASYHSIEENLREPDRQALALVSLGIQSRLVPHAKTARGEWGAVARSTGRPACVIQRFEGECASEIQEPDWDHELKDFEYRVVRWLRWGQAQKSEDESK